MNRKVLLGVGVFCGLALLGARALAEDAQKASSSALLKDAMTAAEKIQDKDAQQLAIGRIAGMQAMTGDIDGAKQTVEKLPAESKVDVYPTLAAVYVTRNDHDGTKALFQQAGEAKSGVVRGVVVALSALGKPQEAEAALKEAQDSMEIAEGQKAIAAAYARAGDFDAVNRVLDQMKGEPTVKVYALADVAGIEAQKGKSAEAAKAIKQATDLAGQSTGPESQALWVAVAQGLERTGNYGDALAVQQKVTDESYKEVILSRIAMAQVELGQLDAASKIAAEINGKGSKITVNCDLAQAQQKAGDTAHAKQAMEEALVALKGIQPQSIASLYCQRFAEVYAKVNGIPAAVSWANELTDPQMRVYALLGAAQATSEYHDPMKP